MKSEPPSWIDSLKLPIVRSIRPNSGDPKYAVKRPRPPSPRSPKPERSEAQRQHYLENMCPYHLFAMEHYNESRKEGEEQYKVSYALGGGGLMCYGSLGLLHMLFWKAQPKSLEKPDPSAAKYFFARVHEMPDNIHVPYCDIYLGPPASGSAIPVCCEICGLEDEDAFIQKSQELEDDKKARELEDDKKARAACLHTYLLNPINVGRQGPLGKSGRSSLGGGQKITISSSVNASEGGLGLKYSNKSCKCGKNAEIMVSSTSRDPNRLFYTCREGKCDFFMWCNPINAEMFVPINSNRDEEVIEEVTQERRQKLRKTCGRFQAEAPSKGGKSEGGSGFSGSPLG